jgi:hypothetical protein
MLSNEQLHKSPVHERLQLSVIRSEPGTCVLSMPMSDDIRGFYEGTRTCTFATTDSRRPAH